MSSYFLNQRDSSDDLKHLIGQAILIRNGGRWDKILLGKTHPTLRKLYIHLIDVYKDKMLELHKDAYVILLEKWKKEINH